jgi:hypothetical protein
MCEYPRWQLIELAARAMVDPATAKRWADPALRARMKPTVRERVDRAAGALGIELPSGGVQ